MSTRQRQQTPHVSASADIEASSNEVYRLLADYRTSHPRILPRNFFGSLRVLRGGFGEGTLITFDLVAFGRTQRQWALVSEPEPGRTLVETYPENGAVTTFTVDSLGPDRSRLTIATTLSVKPGIRGRVELWVMRRFLRRVYSAQLALVDRHLRSDRALATQATIARPRPSMSSRRLSRMILAVLFASGATAEAQCRPPGGTHEARLLAFYEAPLVFSFANAPERLSPGAVTLGGELGNVPSPSAEIQRPEYCYQPHSEHTKLTPVFARPRLTVGLPAGFALEASYLPPVPVGGATPNLASFALMRPVLFTVGAHELTLALRAHGTVGRVRGAITCPTSALQTADANSPCYGTRPSRDTFYPGMFGTEGAVATGDRAGRFSLYAGGGIAWLRPRFRVGFTDASGNVDATEVIADLRRGSAFGGVTVRATDVLQLSAEAYSVPQDVTTVRVALTYQLRGWK